MKLLYIPNGTLVSFNNANCNNRTASYEKSYWFIKTNDTPAKVVSKLCVDYGERTLKGINKIPYGIELSKSEFEWIKD